VRSIEIDHVESWSPVYAPYFTQLAPAEAWGRWLDPEDYSSAEANIEKLAKFAWPNVPVPVVALRDQLEEFFRRNFTHAVFYHACRVNNPADYERDGLRCCDIAEQNRQAVALWGESEALSMALTCGQARNHAKSCHGKVGLWYSRASAMHYGDGYSHGGSEYLRIVADQFGPGRRAQLESRGRPALIRCMLPLAEIDPLVLRTYSSLPLRWQLTRRDPEAPARLYVLDWGFMHEAPVPSERIKIEYLPDTG